jgi:cytidine deaminase
MRDNGDCAHCGKEGRKFEHSRRGGRAIPSNTQHRFEVTQVNNKICSNCYTTIHNNPHSPCGFCRERLSTGALSDALLIVADAARQQNQVATTISTPTSE